MTVFVRRGGAVLGSPIGHSLSPVLHRAAYDATGLSDWTYRAIECSAEHLRATLEQLESESLAGVSLTMPLKRAVLALVARTDRMSADVGAANTVLFGGVAGEWAAANTDVGGFVAALRGAGVTSLPSGMPVAVLGGGATAASALAAVRELGAGAATVFVRRPDGVDDLRAAAARLAIDVEVRPFEAATEAVRSAGLVVATTPAGATDELADRLVAAGLSGGELGVLFDVVYAPWPTRLAAGWAGSGGRVVGGLDLLVEQAALQFELMTGRAGPVEAMRAAGLAALAGVGRA